MGKLLQSEGYEVAEAWNASRAMKCLGEKQIDLVLLDLNLGREDGWEVYQKISQLDGSIPVAIITAAYEQEENAANARVDALVEKPIDITGFLCVVNALLHETEWERKQRRENRGDSLYYIPRWGERYFKRLAERYNKPLRLRRLDVHCGSAKEQKGANAL